MKKFLLYAVAIVVYSVVVVLLRHSEMDIPGWIFWVLGFVLILAVSLIGKTGKSNPTQKDSSEDKNEREL